MTLDRDNAIWIGTSSYGMMKYDPGKQKFKLYSKDLSFLSTFFDEIDTMPMRIDEMSSSQNNC